MSNTSAKSEYKPYTVTMRFQFPAWDEKDGIPFEVTARSKSEAVKYARNQADHDGHLAGGKGRVSFKAVEDEEITSVVAGMEY